MNTPDTKLKLNEEFVWEPMPDGCILYRQSSGQIMTVNPAAELILTYCDGDTPLKDVYQSVSTDVELTEPAFLEAVQKLMDENVLLPV